MSIPANFLDELIARSDIVDVISDYVHLTKKGSNLFGLCPFHSEKTGSFSVSPDKQIYHCFGCGKGGGVINFIMEEENLSFPDAVRFLAKRAGMEVPEEDRHGESSRLRTRVLALNKDAARFYYKLLQGSEGRSVQQYLEPPQNHPQNRRALWHGGIHRPVGRADPGHDQTGLYQSRAFSGRIGREG